MITINKPKYLLLLKVIKNSYGTSFITAFEVWNNFLCNLKFPARLSHAALKMITKCKYSQRFVDYPKNAQSDKHSNLMGSLQL